MPQQTPGNWYQGYTPDTPDAEAIKLFGAKFGYKPLTLTRYRQSALLVGPIGKREPKVGDAIQHSGQSYNIVEVERTLAGFIVLATSESGESEIWEI